MKISLPALAAVYLSTHLHQASGFSQIKSLTCRQCARVGDPRVRSQGPLHAGTYGRGAEIWPESSGDPIRLADSFPNGQVPYTAIVSIEKDDMKAVHERVEETVKAEPRRSKRKMMSKTIRRILRRAAAKEELDSEDVPSKMERTPAVIAVSILVRGLIRPLDFLLVSFLTSYFVILFLAARASRENSDAPVLPSVPPQGHVPAMVSNPMGLRFTYSKTYNIWLKMGVLIGLLGPITLIGRYMFTQDMAAARICARPVFLLCCQALSEAFSRRVMAPLPLRILVPVAYNAARLNYLYDWALYPGLLGPVGRALACANAAYWAINLFVFLLPIASIRYMRAHFFGVEAEEVTTRLGMEESVGLVPHQ